MILAWGFILIFVRIAAMILTAPILGNRSVPVFMKITLAVTISLAVAPPIFANAESLDSISNLAADDLISGVFSEAITGSLIGLGTLIIFSSALMIGAAVGQMSGIQLDSMANSSSGFGQHPATRLIGITTAAVFVLIGGPELILTTVIDSFFSLPLGQTIGSANMLDVITTLLHQSFELTIRAIAPAVATLLVSTIMVGILSRTLPQLNLIQVGLSSNIGIMLMAVFLTIGGCVWLVVDDVERASHFISQSFESFQATRSK